MRYTTHINNAKCLEWGLSLNLGCLFDLFNQLSSWAESSFVDGRLYYYISREKVIEEIPLAFQRPDTVYRAIKTLVDKGLIEWAKVGQRDMVCVTQKGATWNALTNSEINPTLGNKSEARKNIRINSDLNPSAYIDDNITSINNPPYSPPKVKKQKEVSIELQNQFETFWELYPKQRKGDKDKAFKSFTKVVADEKAMPETLIASVKEYAASDEVKEGYAKGCAAWLNDGRYNCVYTHKIAEQEAAEAQAAKNAKALDAERKKLEAERRRAEAEQAKQDELNRLHNKLFAEFLENKGHQSRSSLSINQPELYKQLRQEFNNQYGEVG